MIIPFEKLDEIYAEIGGYNVLNELVSSINNEAIDHHYRQTITKIERYVENEVVEHYYNLHLAPSEDKGHKTKEEADIYFRDLIGKLQMELDRRGRYQEAQDLTMLYADDITNSNTIDDISGDNNRVSPKQYTMSIRERRKLKLIELGLNKTNAEKLALAIEKLCDLMYGGGYDIEGGGSVCD